MCQAEHQSINKKYFSRLFLGGGMFLAGGILLAAAMFSLRGGENRSGMSFFEEFFRQECLPERIDPMVRFITEQSQGKNKIGILDSSVRACVSDRIEAALQEEGRNVVRGDVDRIGGIADVLFSLRTILESSGENTSITTSIDSIPVRDRFADERTEIFLLGYPSIRLTTIADIHAGEEDRDKGGDNVVFRANFRENLDLVKASARPELLLVLGDISDAGVAGAREVRERLVDIPTVLWTRGNHDNDEEWAVFSDRSDFVVDRDGWRFIVLDSNQRNANISGGVTREQVEWVREQLRTSNKVVFAMHHPMIYFDLENFETIRPYRELKAVLEEAGNVKYVFCGHKHIWDGCHEESGIRYCIQRALSLRDHEGSFSEYLLE